MKKSVAFLGVVALAGVLVSEVPARAGELTKTSLQSAGTRALIFDLRGNGLDLSGTSRSGLLGAEGTTKRWTKANTDDAFLVLDATRLRDLGFDIRNADGKPIDGNTLFRDGLRVRRAGGKELLPRIGWELLSLFDSNKDGKINASDKTWTSLKLFTDANADGTIGAAELRPVSDAKIRFVALPELDANGNLRSKGTFTRGDGTTGTASDVNFAK